MNRPVLRSTRRALIDTVGKWRQLVPRERWGRGKPIALLAERWITSELSEVDALLASRQPTSGFVADEGQVVLPDLDLVVWGRASGGATLLGVLPLSDEPLGPTVDEAFGQWRQHHRQLGAGSPVEQRAQTVFGVPWHVIHDLPHALLQGCAAVLREAAARSCAQAVLIVHELRTPLVPAQLVGDQVAAVEGFVRRLLHGESAAPGVLVGPLERANLQLYLGRAVITL